MTARLNTEIYNADVKRALLFATALATTQGQKCGLDHLIVGILSQSHSSGAEILREQGVTMGDAVTSLGLRWNGTSLEFPATVKHAPLTESAVQALAFAERVADQERVGSGWYYCMDTRQLLRGILEQASTQRLVVISRVTVVQLQRVVRS